MCGLFKRFAVSVASLSLFFTAAGSFAQVSSSAQNHDDFQTLVQDQYPNQGGYNSRQSNHSRHSDTWVDHLAIEGGGGLTIPVGNTRTWQTVGFNINAGAGWNFNDRFGVLGEYSFNRSSIPTNTLTNVGEPNGNVHIWSLGLSPIFYLKTGGSLGAYVTGGGGFYRKLTTFTQPVYVGQYCDYFYGCLPQYQNVTLSHFSSNQGGANIGAGGTFKFNPDGKGKFYAEVRYVWVNSPKSSATAVGTGTVSMIPITFGYRW